MLDACAEEIRNRKLKGAFGSSVFGFQEATLDALHDLPELEAVWFWDVELNNIDALYELAGLQFFGVHPKRPAIDFSRFPLLRDLIWTHKPKDTGIRSLKSLDRIHVWHYAPKTKSFAELQLPEQLTELQIIWANPNSLEGLSSIPTLRRLEIHHCRNLESLAPIPQLFPMLEHLVVSACGRVADDEGERLVAQLPSIKHAFVKNRKVA